MTERQKILDRSKCNNPKKYGIDITLTFRYMLCYLITFTVGLILYYVIKVPHSRTLDSFIDSYFSQKIAFDKNMSNNILSIIDASLPDIKTMILIFVSGFTLFCSPALYGLLSYHALSLGFSSIYLLSAMSRGDLLNINFFALVFFLLINSITSSIKVVRCFGGFAL